MLEGSVLWLGSPCHAFTTPPTRSCALTEEHGNTFTGSTGAATWPFASSAVSSSSSAERMAHWDIMQPLRTHLESIVFEVWMALGAPTSLTFCALLQADAMVRGVVQATSLACWPPGPCAKPAPSNCAICTVAIHARTLWMAVLASLQLYRRCSALYSMLTCRPAGLAELFFLLLLLDRYCSIRARSGT